MVSAIAAVVFFGAVWFVLYIAQKDVKSLEDDLALVKRENLRLAKAVLSQKERIEEVALDSAAALEIVRSFEKSLTSEPAKQKIPVKPKVQSWKNFKSSIEKASVPEEEI